MSHNTPLANAEFKLTWNETNLRYLLGDNPKDEAKITRARKWIEETKQDIETLKTEASK